MKSTYAKCKLTDKMGNEMKRTKVSRNSPCPCGSEKKYKKCCGPLHEGKPAATPDRLVRARYCAYVLSNVKYIMQTTHPDSPHRRDDELLWQRELRDHCASTIYNSLTFDEIKIGDNEGWVSFSVSFEQGGISGSRGERSYFLLHDGLWKYVYGLRKPC